jgi:membrane-associated phospholipid phosphatase
MFRRPDTRTVFAFFTVAMQLAFTFVLLYGGTNWLAEQRTESAHLWMGWELSIPLLPAMILPYFSIHLLMMAPLFTMGASEIRVLGRGFILATLLAAIVFFFLPAHIGFHRSLDNLGPWRPLFQWLFLLDKSANTFPSLHITYTVLIVRGISYYSRNLAMNLFLACWGLLIAASVLLTHQHHVIDIAGGLALAEFCFWTVVAKSTELEEAIEIPREAVPAEALEAECE